MFGPKAMTWWFYSATDSRWNCDGRAEGFVMDGMVPEAKVKLDSLKLLYGEPPADLRYNCMKD